MKPRTSPIVLGFIWGILAMMLSFAVFCVFASLKLVFTGFPLFAYDEQSQYLLIGAVFLLGVLGAIGAGIMPRLMRLGGVFLLLSCIGVTGLLFAPVIMQSFSFEPLTAYGIHISPLPLLIADFSMGVLTAIGLLGGILAFIPKRTGRHRQHKSPAYTPRLPRSRNPLLLRRLPLHRKQRRLRLPLYLPPLSRSPFRPPLRRRRHPRLLTRLPLRRQKRSLK